MQFNPDQTLYWQFGLFKINATLVYTWGVMALLVFGAWLATRRLSPKIRPGRWQNFLESLVNVIRGQIRDVTHQEPDQHLPFVGTLFLFIALSNLLAIVPGYIPPTSSLSTTTALAICVFIAVPLYGIRAVGWKNYLLQYLQPTPIMLPFNIIGEFSRTLALAVRLYGNIMSGAVIGAVLLTLTPFFFPIVMQLLGLLTGFIQAYIFAILALVYIASASVVVQEKIEKLDKNEEET
ncbi:MAG: F0F1 ATP synthase subunit A [Methylothermaceae bacteria B42]|nr:MAG: F0F1 ATP synthase subunit A [Methylothermaceae bacteria B42]HHJ38369.1 F0F1 ATP synthase subunit A [Methylothermaceae bacterium]